MADFNAYFSHKWNIEYLQIHASLWRRLATQCRLILDQPVPAGGEERPYFVSRLESLMRRADVMVCVIPQQGVTGQRHDSQRADYRFVDCSPYILFELRLAERMGIPRFVLYDRRSSFTPEPSSDPIVAHVSRDFQELADLLAAGHEDQELSASIDEWLQKIARSRRPRNWTIPRRSGVLVSRSSPSADRLPVFHRALQASGFDLPEHIVLDGTDAALMNQLRSLGILLVDVTDPDALPLLHMAHSLMVPTLRVRTAQSPLPSLYQGHPAGYQLDIVDASNNTDETTLLQQLRVRGEAVARGVRPVVGMEQAIALLHQRTYLNPAHQVFVSHNEKPGERVLVELLVKEFEQRGIRYWEYAVENRAGVDWRQKMQSGLENATHMVALVAPRYEKSEGCMQEWNHAMQAQIPLLPFLTRGRSESVVFDRDFKIAHDSRLSELDIPGQARWVAERVASVLRGDEELARRTT